MVRKREGRDGHTHTDEQIEGEKGGKGGMEREGRQMQGEGGMDREKGGWTDIYRERV